MKRAVIIGNGDIKNYSYIKSKLRADDHIICADGGYNHTLKMGVEPDMIIGDFDSAENVGDTKNKITYPRKKDFTDGEAALDYAIENGFDSVLFLAMTGGRLDHTLTDIFLLSKCESAVLIDDNNEIYFLRDTLSIEGRKGQTISIIPLSGGAHGIVTEGLEYPLCGETLDFASSRGVSNVMLGEKCKIMLTSGAALVIKIEKV